jgi:hypothetical protein
VKDSRQNVRKMGAIASMRQSLQLKDQKVSPTSSQGKNSAKYIFAESTLLIIEPYG